MNLLEILELKTKRRPYLVIALIRDVVGLAADLLLVMTDEVEEEAEWVAGDFQSLNVSVTSLTVGWKHGSAFECTRESDAHEPPTFNEMER